MPVTQTGAILGKIVSNLLTFLAAIFGTQKVYEMSRSEASKKKEGGKIFLLYKKYIFQLGISVGLNFNQRKN